MVITISVIESKARQSFAALAIGGFGTLVLAAGQPQEPCVTQGLFWIPQGAGITFLFALLIRNVLGIPEGTPVIGVLGVIGNSLKASLAPHRWSGAVGKPALSQRDLSKRVFVAISAGTGGVVGSLISLGLFWETLQEDFGIRGLFNTVVLTMVSVTLIGPLHEYIMDRGLAASPPHHGAPVQGIFSEFSPKVVLRVGMVVTVFFMLDMTQASLDRCVRDGELDAMFLIALGGITPALVSYYWSAALQLGVPSVFRSATWPSMVAGAVMFSMAAFGASVFISALWGVFEPPHDHLESSGLNFALNVLFSVVGLTCGLALGVSLLICGVYAAAGGYAMDRFTGRYSWLALIMALGIATVPQQMLSNWIISSVAGADAGREELGIDQTPAAAEPRAPTLTPIAAALQRYGMSLCRAAKPPHAEAVTLDAKENLAPTNLYLFLGTAGWLVGLYASGFPELLRRRASPTVGQPNDAI